MTVKEIAATQGKPARTIYGRIERAQEALGAHNIDDMRSALYQLFDKCRDAIDDGLTRGDAKDRANVALRTLSGLSVLSDKTEVAVTVDRSDRVKRLSHGLAQFGYVAELPEVVEVEQIEDDAADQQDDEADQQGDDGGGVPGEGGETPQTDDGGDEVGGTQPLTEIQEVEPTDPKPSGID